jgi:glycogen debranching enzyme
MASQPIDTLLINANSGDHLYHFSNKEGSFYVGETKGTTRHFLMGYISYREQLFSDYTLFVNGDQLKRNDESTRVSYLPYILRRTYSGGITGSVFMPDHEDALCIRVASDNLHTATLKLFGNLFKKILAIDSSGTPNRVTVSLNSKISPSLTVALVGKLVDARLSDNTLIVKANTAKIHSGHMKVDNSEELFVIGVGGSTDQSNKTAIASLTGYNSLVTRKKKRLNKLLEQSPLTVSDQQVDDALGWARCAFDALNMDETGMGKGIYAGYPWFQDYWGRDSFIAMRALTITGRFALVKENLESFLKYQKLDDDGPLYGKIPNRVRPDQQIYNTADATPRFLIETQRYVAYSADSSFARDIFPNIEAAVLGTLKYRTDTLGFIVHGPADTWMDAVGPKGPYSPRGNRANDIQALWIEALQSSVKLCQEAGGIEAASLSQKVKTALGKVEKSFVQKFVNPSNPDPLTSVPVVYDALHSDGEPSMELRPNVLFCLDVIDRPEIRQKALLQVFDRLSTPFGVMSLDPDDPHFHPFHQFEPVYEQDAAYHSGIIWLWNTGELVDQMTRRFLQDKVYPVTQNYSKLILKGTTLGTLPELLDAFPRDTKYAREYPDSASFNGLSRFDQMNIRDVAGLDRAKVPAESGTFSQAWSLSEYIRSFYESYAGIRYQANNGFSLRPALPSGWQTLSVKSTLGVLDLSMDAKTGKNESMHYTIEIVNRSEKKQHLPFQDKFMKKQIRLTVPPGLTRFDITTAPENVNLLENGKHENPVYQSTSIMNAFQTAYAKKFHFRDINAIPIKGRHYYSQTH